MKNVYIIAEIGQAHEGSLGLAHSYIDALSDIGLDAIKFQMHIAHAESSEYEPLRVLPSYQDRTRQEYWRRMEFTMEQWKGLKMHCDSKKLDMIVSPFSMEAVALSDTIGIATLKVGSGDVQNRLMVDAIARTAKKIIMSTGMSTISELDPIIKRLKALQCNLALMQCTSAYPTTPDQWGLNNISLFRHRYKIPIGFSDHSGDVFACLAAVATGARLIEFHVTFDKRMFGPDTSSSVTIDQCATLVKGIRQIENALNSPVDKTDNQAFEPLRQAFGKSLAVNKKLNKGHILTIGDLESKKPLGYGISSEEYLNVIGKPIKTDIELWAFLTEKHI
jgi:N,N'-diacetyllegionaminate synthase